MDPQQQQQQQQQQLQQHLQLQRQQLQQQQPINTNVHPLAAPPLSGAPQPLPLPLSIPPLPLALTIPPLAPDQALISTALASPPAVTPVPASAVKAPTATLLQQQKQLIQEQQRRMSLNAASNSPPAGAASTPTTPVTPMQVVGVTPLPLASPVGTTNPVPTTSQLLAAAAQTRLSHPPPPHPPLPTQDPQRSTQPPTGQPTSVPTNLTTPAQGSQTAGTTPTPAIATPGASTPVPQPSDQNAPPTPTTTVPVIHPPQPLIKIEEPLKSSSASSAGSGASGSAVVEMTSNEQQKYPKGEAISIKEPSGSTTMPMAIAPTVEGSRPAESATATPASSSSTVTAATSTPPAVLVQIFKATYSGVPVYEMICKGVAVMRRRSDSYLNATQILKVAEFDKPQRTRILEREVQKGEHEKVQGGYGKYQGTWVPFARGVLLCEEYNVKHLLRPLLEYQATSSSPPLAPKHITAATNRPRKPREPRKAGTPTSDYGDGDDTTMTSVKGGFDDMSSSEMDDDQSQADSDASMDDTMSVVSDHSMTPSPMDSRRDMSSSDISDNEGYSPGRRRARSSDRSPMARKKYARPGDELFLDYHGGDRDVDMESRGEQSSQIEEDEDGSPSLRRVSSRSPRRRMASGGRQGASGENDFGSSSSLSAAISAVTGMSTATAAEAARNGRYAEILLDYFVSDAATLPKILTHPPADLDFDLVIDEEGHTPLHWAVAMAKTKVVRLLVQHGADIYRANHQGQTALMRSVMFTNNFDMKTFPTLVEILQKTIFTIDKNDQTVFHHVAATAGMRGKVHASRYYMECLLEKLAQHPSELASIINFQDVEGDTALMMAARIGNKKLVRVLLEAGADTKIRNRTGQNAEEYMQESEAAAAALSAAAASVTEGGTEASTNPSSKLSKEAAHMSRSPKHPTTLTLSHQLQAPPMSSHFGSGSNDFAHPSRNPFQIFPPPAVPTGPLYSHLQEANSRSSPNLDSDRRFLAERMMGGTSAMATNDGGRSPQLGASSSSPSTATKPSHKVIPTVTTLFGQLTQSYEKDLFDKEQDLAEARNMLHGIQAEIQEGHRTIEELRGKTLYLSKAEDQIRILEGRIRQEMQTRQWLRLEELVAKEEEGSQTGERPGALDQEGRVQASEQEAERLAQELEKLQQRRKEQVEEAIQLKSLQGKRRHEYKRLIALCCNVSIDEVDGLLGPLLNSLGTAENSNLE
ncbi:hypothetical protein BGZ52_013158 [Haplosporangium bisporale]|nr:hypothetical protein BGZ52_013158 [Haplosporangium bisporale]